MKVRIVCLHVPMFPLAARLRSEPELLPEAVAIVDGNGANAHVVAATRRARSQGVRPGLSLAQARSLVPKLIARGRDAECERTAQEALLEVAETFSPRVEDGREGIVYFDIRRGAGLQPPAKNNESPPDHEEPPDENALERDLARRAMRAAEAVGLPARCGVAASKLAARVAAELPRSPTVVEAGKEAEFLAPLPLARLSPELDAAITLQRWGLASAGDLARLSESEVASRLGEMGRELHSAARGIDPRPLMPRALPPEFREGMELEWPLVALEPFLFIASAALDRLAARLEMQGFACRRLEVTMTLEPEGHHARAIELPAPTRDVKTMLTLIRLELEKNPPGAPVAGFSIVAYPDRPRRAQLSLFGPAALAPEKLATTIARLISILGEGRVGMPATVDGYLPERFAIEAFDPPPPPDLARAPKKSRGLVAVRVFRPPVAIDVAMHEGRLAAVRSDGDINGSVRVASGPWQVEEGWWRDEPAYREYWDVELEGGAVYRMYWKEGWFVDARYD